MLRCALHIISGRIIYNFAILENLRIFQNCLFTGWVVEENGICSAAFCESAALRGIPPQSLLRKASSPKGTPYGNAGNFAAAAKSRPLGEGGIAAGDDGRGLSPLLRKKSQFLEATVGKNRKSASLLALAH